MTDRTHWRELLQQPPGDSDHIVQFYQDEHFLADAVCEFAAAGLEKREAVVMIVTSSHARMYRERLTRMGYDVAELEAANQVLFLDAQHTLSSFLVNGHPDHDTFWRVVGDAISKVCADGRYARVRAHGEMVNLLWLEGNFFGALRLEELWNELARHYSFVLLCSYFLDVFAPPTRTTRGVMHTHSHVIPAEDYARMESAVEKAMIDILGESQAQRVRSQIGAGSVEPSWAPMAQRILYWLHNNLPHSAGDVYLRARRYYYANATRPALSPACD